MIIIKNNTLTFDELKAEIQKYIKNKNKLNKIYECYKFAEEMHKGQKRKSGEDFIQHPLYTALFIAKWRLGTVSICTALLHDILEDTPITYNDIEKKFGTEIAKLVESVTKVSYFAKENRKQIKSMYLRKLYISLAKDIRVIIIKIADRLHNMQTISFHNEQKQKEIAKETLEIYSAISHRLGMKEAQSELEDLSFKVLNPLQYKRIEHQLELSQDKLKKVLISAKEKIRRNIAKKLNKEYLILNRTKSIYSIYRKIHLFGKSFEDIYDILAIRIIVDTIDECYNVLGLIHKMFIPLPGKFKDFISVPKNNLYQSLHTTVTNSGHIFEVQIRTYDMDSVAQFGAAAHWRYKEGEEYNLKQKQEDIENKLDIFSQILELQNSSSENANFDFEKEIKQDIFSSLIYVLTPKGKVITLPTDSTVLDFAYKIHSEIGHSTIGAKINGVFSSISTKLKSGDLVEILTSKSQKPNYNWLNIAKTNSAKDKIKKFIKKLETEKNNILNKKITDNEKIELAKKRIKERIEKEKAKDKKILKNIEMNEKINELGYDNINKFLIDVYEKIYSIDEACKLLFSDDILKNNEEKFISEFQNKNRKKTKKIENDLLVKGVSNIHIGLAKCCTPIPFEKIIGVITKKTRMIKVHLENCLTLSKIENKETIEVHWNKNIASNKDYSVKIVINCFDKLGTIMKISSLINYYNSSIEHMSIHRKKMKMEVTIKMILKVKTKSVLNHIFAAINNLSNIQEVKRAIS